MNRLLTESTGQITGGDSGQFDAYAFVLESVERRALTPRPQRPERLQQHPLDPKHALTENPNCCHLMDIH
ncbi:hypothetical protein CesoFtcFv8_015666 [Champsocephalus esox]|uniref:Uncharacterized protein n=1 Tax=Champsocephalus esox TaxID=159716 RepID=A0AAN8BSS6_9TELE|nr:hypothetical protein CesoFtcFv8_015666 [Champsocephalus esox]